MPTIACPGCGKQYKLPETAAGQVAKCACGKRFRLSAPSTPAPAASAVRSKAKAQSAATARPSAPAPTASNDDFWNEAIAEEHTVKPAATIVASALNTPSPKGEARPTGFTKPETTTAPKKKKRKKIRWGFDWGKVAAGALTFLIAGGITVGLALVTGYIYFWPAGIAIVGFFTMLSGLMGEEGIW